ncbi:OLC1v1002952C1 [Oldenlandia corymbosa var. corymbosa]|uniref:OLC1v1002952C1 n=1 Tax=Oldenlandia corymbosa var. corymbosa TaxID=529605 RepID=A0AAV1D8Z7_OLDCO|nr:OLC1v1002952C1 [Oldenlandia corymbosa var. corymbosa]
MSDNHIPDNLIAEVLLRLPFDSLIRFRCVSKSWRNLIDSPFFIEMHSKIFQLISQRNRTDSADNKFVFLGGTLFYTFNSVSKFDGGSYRAITRELKRPPLEFRSGELKIVGSSNGIICLWNIWTDELALWNPWIQHYYSLPAPPYEFTKKSRIPRNVAFGYDHVNDDFKVVKWHLSSVRISFSSNVLPKSRLYGICVYSLKLNSWRRIQSSLSFELPDYQIFFLPADCVLVNGALHWLVIDFTGVFENLIVRFDLGSEEFHKMSVGPSNIDLPYTNTNRQMLCNLNGCLSLICDKFNQRERKRRLEVWMLEDYGDSWTEATSIEFPDDLQFRDVTPVAFLKKGRKMLLKIDRRFALYRRSVIYDLEKKSFRDVTVSDEVNCCFTSCICVGSFVSPCIQTLPIESLLRFRCVSRSWRDLIDSPFFIKLHSKRSQLISQQNHHVPHPAGSKIVTLKGTQFYTFDSVSELDGGVSYRAIAKKLKSPSLEFSDQDLEIVGSCNGILCLWNLSTDDVALWNPGIQRCSVLPLPPNEFTMRFRPFMNVAFGYDRVNDDYKVVKWYLYTDMHMYSNYDSNSSGYEPCVYSLKLKSWRRITGSLPFEEMEEGCNFFPADSAVVHGAIHWLMYTRPIGHFIVAFDLGSEEFHKTSIGPSNIHSQDTYEVSLQKLCNLNGYICLIRYKYSHHEGKTRGGIWILEDYAESESSWTELISIDFPNDLRFWGFKPVSFSRKRNKMLLEIASEKLVLYDLDQKSFKDVTIRDDHMDEGEQDGPRQEQASTSRVHEEDGGSLFAQDDHMDDNDSDYVAPSKSSEARDPSDDDGSDDKELVNEEIELNPYPRCHVYKEMGEWNASLVYKDDFDIKMRDETPKGMHIKDIRSLPSLQDGKLMCKWRIRVSLGKHGLHQIVKWLFAHTCMRVVNDNDNRCADSVFIARIIMRKVANNMNYTVKSVQKDVKELVKVDVPYKRAWNGRRKAIEAVYGDWSSNFEDLPWLPFDSLIRFRCVSKSWRDMIDNPFFIEMHSERSKECPPHSADNKIVAIKGTTFYSFDSVCKLRGGFCRAIATREFSSPPLEFHERGLEIVGSANGILCLWNHLQADEIGLWNPWIQHYFALPLPPYEFTKKCRPSMSAAFGYDRNNGDYKVVKWHIYSSKYELPNSRRYELCVYSLKLNSWKRIQSSSSSFPISEVYEDYYFPAECAFINGTIHWIASDILWGVEKFIVAFDLGSEGFHKMSCGPANTGSPAMIGNIVIDPKLCNLNGSLSFYCNRLFERERRRFGEIWTMDEDYGGEYETSWTPLTTINFPDPDQVYWDFKPVTFSKKKKKLLLQSGLEKLMMYDLAKDSLEDVTISGEASCFTCCACVGSLVSPLFLAPAGTNHSYKLLSS